MLKLLSAKEHFSSPPNLSLFIIYEYIPLFNAYLKQKEQLEEEALAPGEEETEFLKKQEGERKSGSVLNTKKLGVKVYNITPELREKYNLPEEETGVVVSEVDSGGPACEVGLSPGDVIKMVNHIKISSLSDFKKAMEKVKPGDMVLLRVRHAKRTMFFTIQTRK